ncbi:MAG: DNA repair protein RecO [Patescibacteria group bacterium]|nr:DNA repair protein RecO [Patescibacteria group bacterium]
MSTYLTKGIILKKSDLREVDQLFSIYTEHHGKVSAIGRGTKKMVSKLNGQLSYFGIIYLMLARGKVYDHVAAAEMVINFSSVTTNLKKIVLASFALELVDKLTKLEEPDSRIFSLLSKYLESINEHDFKDDEWEIIRQAFVVKLLALLGFDPPTQVINQPKKLDHFLHQQLDVQLNSDKFLHRIKPLTTG